jgi:hypothetical protein
MAAHFGIEGLRYFDRAVAEGGIVLTGGKGKFGELPYTYDICNGLESRLSQAGHVQEFYWLNDDCWEIDLRSATQGGIDSSYSDNVDLFFILTHGGYWDKATHLVYNVAMDDWSISSKEWRLGDKKLNWLCLYGCHSIDIGQPLDHLHVFQGLHELCGSYGDMYSGWKVTEVGEDFADNMIDGDPVSRAWLSGVSDWWIDNHPMVLAVERRDTWNNGNPEWSKTTLNRDHLWGHGTTVSDISPTNIYWMSWISAEG